jgi:hypothetical protein
MQVWEPWTIFWLMGGQLLAFAVACLLKRTQSEKMCLHTQES